MAKKGGRITGSSDTPDLKKAQPVNTVDDPAGGPGGGSASPPVSGRSGGNFLTKMKDGLSGLANTAGGAITNGLRGAAHNWFGLKPMTQGISSFVSSVAADLHIPQQVVAVGLSLLTLGGAGMGGIAIMNHSNMELLTRQAGYYDPCGGYSDAEKSGASFDDVTGVANLSEEQKKNASMFMGVFANLGMTEEQCIGMLASIMQESGLDPTTIEGVFSSKYVMSAEKLSYFNSDGYSFNQANTTQKLQRLGSDYASKGIWISPDYHDHGGYYDQIGSQWTLGIGMIQYTGPSAGQLLRFAQAAGKRWYDLDLQIAFFLSDESGFASRLQRMLNDMKVNSVEHDAAQAVNYWTGYIEMGKGHPDETSSRVGNLGTVQGLGLDYDALRLQYETLANDIAGMAGTTVSAAMVSHSKNILRQCNGIDLNLNVTNNVQLAELCVSYAYATTVEGYTTSPTHRGGTDLYLYLRSQVCPTDAYYASCDRSVAVGVLASGADSKFPLGATGTQFTYLMEQSTLAKAGKGGKWLEIGSFKAHEDEVAPGDIVITNPNGHIVMYVGPEVTANAGKSGEFMSGSIGGPPRYPGCGHTKKVYSVYDDRNYWIFRYVGDFSDNKADLTM